MGSLCIPFSEMSFFKPPIHCFFFLFSILSEDSADLESIEAVANEVLNMEMPSTPEQLQTLADNIRDRVESLSDVDTVLQQSAGDIARAKMLLDEAKKARWYIMAYSVIDFCNSFLCVWLAYQIIKS